MKDEMGEKTMYRIVFLRLKMNSHLAADDDDDDDKKARGTKMCVIKRLKDQRLHRLPGK